MRKMFALLFVIAALGVRAHAANAPTPHEQPAVPTVVSAVDLAASPAPALPAATLPSCGSYNGNACSTPGTIVRCQWIPYEPDICVCSSSYVWVCG